MTPFLSFPAVATAPDPDSAEALRLALLRDRPGALTRLYRQAFPVVRRHVQRHGGSAQDAQDVFQDALVVLYERATTGRLTLTGPASAYLLGVSRNLWRRELLRRARYPAAQAEDAPGQLPADIAELPAADEAAAPPVREFVEQLGARCRAMLLAFYYFQQPLADIAATHGYGSVRSATVQKFKCLERLRKSVRAAWQAAEAVLTY